MSLKGPTLERQAGQTIIAGDVIFRIERVRGCRVVVKVLAPEGVPIIRGELAGQPAPKLSETR